MQTIVFIHGMFQNPKSWQHWIKYFTERGYKCIAPAWPGHEGEPEELREHPHPDLGDLRLKTIVRVMEDVIAGLPETPIVIGHSVGGLIVQLLANKALISLGVPISSVAPNAMLSMDWDFFKNSITITNPLKGNQPILTTPESFHDSFANTLSDADAKKAFEETATHDSRNVLRDCVLEAKVDLDLPHVPLLFISGEQDKIIPHELVEKNSKAYTSEESTTSFKLFPNRSHFICGEPGWEEVAAYVDDWLSQHKKETAYEGVSSLDKDS